MEVYYLLFLIGVMLVFGGLVFLTWYLILRWSGKLKPTKKSKKSRKKTEK